MVHLACCPRWCRVIDNAPIPYGVQATKGWSLQSWHAATSLQPDSATCIQARQDLQPAACGLHDRLAPPRKAVTLLVGAPGSGKGTIGLDIARELGCTDCVAMSDVLRQQGAAGGPAEPAHDSDALTSSAQLVGDALACSAFEALLSSSCCGAGGGIMVDGFPRSQAQVSPLPHRTCSHSIASPSFSKAPLAPPSSSCRAEHRAHPKLPTRVYVHLWGISAHSTCSKHRTGLVCLIYTDACM